LVDLEGASDIARRCSAVSPTWLAVRRTRFSTEQSTGTPVSLPTAKASMADWLKRRHHSREG
jgi:hypothetical protein